MEKISADKTAAVFYAIVLEKLYVKLKEWYDLLGKSGENTKKQVRDEIGELLKKMKMDDIDKIVQAMVEDKLELFNYLIKHWCYKQYNAKGEYWIVSFDIDDEEIMTRLNKYLDRAND